MDRLATTYYFLVKNFILHSKNKDEEKNTRSYEFSNENGKKVIFACSVRLLLMLLLLLLLLFVMPLQWGRNRNKTWIMSVSYRKCSNLQCFLKTCYLRSFRIFIHNTKFVCCTGWIRYRYRLTSIILCFHMWCNVSGCACFFLLENILITFYCYFFCRIVLLFHIRLYIFRYFAQAIRKASNFHMHMYVSGTVEYIHWLLAIYISTYHRKIEKQTSGSDDEQKITEQNNKFK